VAKEKETTGQKPVKQKLKEEVKLMRDFEINTETAVKVDVTLKKTKEEKGTKVQGLLDSGATGMFINRQFVRELGITGRRLAQPLAVFNADGTLNRSGVITEEIDLFMMVDDHKELVTFKITNLGRIPLIVGHSWLKKHNPTIDWRTGAIEMTRCPRECGVKRRKKKNQEKQKKKPYPRYVNEAEEEKEEEKIFVSWFLPGDVRDDDEELLYCEKKNGKWEAHEINALPHHQSWFYDEKDVNRKTEDAIPAEYQDFADVFDKGKSERFPKKKQWDHGIDLKEGFVPQNSKIYPLSQDEQMKLDEWLDEQLQKGYI
jgi:hypothetical protein